MTVVVPFLGILPISIETYTTTYTPINSAGNWSFDPLNITPMEYAGYGTNPGAPTWLGSQGNIFTRNFITPFSVGNVSGAINNVYGACGWYNNKLFVFAQIPNGTSQTEPWGMLETLPLNGVGVTDPSPAQTHLQSLPDLPNTATNAPNLGWGGIAAAPLDTSPVFGAIVGGLYSFVINGTSSYGVWDGGNNTTSLADPAFSTNDAMAGILPIAPGVSGNNNIYVDSNVNGDSGPTFTQSNLLGPPTLQTSSFQAPASSTVNFDTYIHTNTNKANFRPTSLGYLAFDAGNVTVNGVAMVGYGILILPGFNGYYIVNISGTDALSETWATATGKGSIWGAAGADSDLFMKWNNTNDTLFISTVPVVIPLNPLTAFSRQRAWQYTLDGHTFYVLDLGNEGTFAYDVDTKEWAQFQTQPVQQFNVANGTMYGTRVVGGDLQTTDVWELAGSALTDNGTDIQHVVTGGIAVRTREYRSCEAVKLTVSKGQYGDTVSPTISLRFSDDGGQTWSAYYTLSLVEGENHGSITWTSLGSFKSPGRVFEFSDTGGPIRIDGADVFIDDFDEDVPQGQEGQ